MGRAQELRIVDPVLTQFIRGYSNAEFVGINLFPVVEVSKEAGKIPMFGKEAFRLYDTERAMRAKSNKIDVEKRDSFLFTTTEQDATYPIDYREVEEDIINTEQYGAYRAQSAVMLKHEKRCAELAIDLANYPTGNKTTLTGSNQFTNAQSNPIAVIRTASEAIRAKTAKRPNTMIMGALSFAALQDHQLITERIKYSQLGIVTVDLLEALFNVKNIFVADAVFENSTGTVTDVWGDNIVLAYVPEQKTDVARSIYEPSFGYTLRKKGFPQGDMYDEDGGKIHNVRSTDNFTIEIVGADAGYLIADTNA